MGEEKVRQGFYDDLPGFVPVCSVCGAEWHTAVMHTASSAAFDIEFFVVPPYNSEGRQGNDIFASKPSFVSLREPISLETKDSGDIETEKTQAIEGSLFQCSTRRSLRGFDSVSLLTASPCDLMDAGYHSDEDDLQYDECLEEYEMGYLYDRMEGVYEDEEEEEELKAALQRQGSELFSLDDHETSTDTEAYEEQDEDIEADEQLLDREGGIESIMLGGIGEEESDELVVPPLEDGDFSSDDEECDGGHPCWGPKAFKPVFVARTGRKFTLPRTAAKAPPKIVKQVDEVSKQNKEKDDKESASTNEKQTKQEAKSESVVKAGKSTETLEKTAKETETQEAPIIGRCASEKCIQDSRIIRETDDRVEVMCSLKRPCVVWYHLKCWRLYDKATGITSSADKNHVRCVTPDCEGFIRTIRRFTRRSGDIKQHVSEFRKSDYIDPVVAHNESSESSGTLGVSQNAGETNAVSGNKKGKKKSESDTKKDTNEATTTAGTLKSVALSSSISDKQKEITESVHTTGTSDPLMETCTRKDKKKLKTTRKQSSDAETVVATSATGLNTTRNTNRLTSPQSLGKPHAQQRESNVEHSVPVRQEQTKITDTGRAEKSVGMQSGNMWESKTSLQQLKASLRGNSSEANHSDYQLVVRQTCESCPKDNGRATTDSKLETPQKVMSERIPVLITSSPPRRPTQSVIKTNPSTQLDTPTKSNEDGPKFVVSAPAFVPRLGNCNETSTNTQQKPAWTPASTPFLPGKSSTPTPPKVTEFYVVPFPTVSPRRVVYVHPSLFGWPFSDSLPLERIQEKDCDECSENTTTEETEIQFTALSRVLAHLVDGLIGKESPTITIIPPSFPAWKLRQVSTTVQPSPPLSADFPPLGTSPTPPPSPFRVSSSWSPQQQKFK